MIQTILKNRNKHIDKIVSDFQKEFEALSIDIQDKILRLIRSGNFNREAWDILFQDYDDFAEAYLARNAELIKYTRQVADELGVKFALTQENLEAYDKLQDIIFDRLKNLKAQYIDDMRMFGLRSQLEGASREKMMAGLTEIFETTGRNLNAEINTATAYMDAVLKKDMYEQAGIEKYKYFGPVDDRKRLKCNITMDDPKQKTGWTMEDIEASGTPFITRGGWGCRDEWIPFVED